MTADEQSRELLVVQVTSSRRGSIELSDIEVRNPAGEELVHDLGLRLTPGDAMIITGKSGTGKSTLLRSLAQLWPFSSGQMECPSGDNETMFLSQPPYVPRGDLRTVVSYPHEPGELSEGTVGGRVAALRRSARRGGRLGQGALPGEQQRIAFARLLLTRPKAIFLDEATSALDEPLEFMIYSLVRRELAPDGVRQRDAPVDGEPASQPAPGTARRGPVGVRADAGAATGARMSRCPGVDRGITCRTATYSDFVHTLTPPRGTGARGQAGPARSASPPAHAHQPRRCRGRRRTGR